MTLYKALKMKHPSSWVHFNTISAKGELIGAASTFCLPEFIEGLCELSLANHGAGSIVTQLVGRLRKAEIFLKVRREQLIVKTES